MSRASQKRETRIFYRKATGEVVVLQNGTELASYGSVNQLIETHIKGIKAKSLLDNKVASTTQIRYCPVPAIGSFE